MSYGGDETTVDYQARRVQLASNVHFDSLIAAFELVVPVLSDVDALARVSEDGDWSTFVRGLQWESPSGLVCVWSSRPGDIMRHAGSRASSKLWLMVNYGIAARLFRHDPGAILYSPIRIEAHTTSRVGAEADGDGPTGTIISFDIPSMQLRSFGINKVTQAGAELDRALGDLIEAIGLPRPSVLRR